jgi:hypothetical protein
LASSERSSFSVNAAFIWQPRKSLFQMSLASRLHPGYHPTCATIRRHATPDDEKCLSHAGALASAARLGLERFDPADIKEYVPMKDLVAPAIANALANATGVGFPHLPFTADRIFSKLQP